MVIVGFAPSRWYAGPAKNETIANVPSIGIMPTPALSAE